MLNVQSWDLWFQSEEWTTKIQEEEDEYEYTQPMMNNKFFFSQMCSIPLCHLGNQYRNIHVDQQFENGNFNFSYFSWLRSCVGSPG